MRSVGLFIIAIMAVIVISFRGKQEAENIWTKQTNIADVIAFEKAISSKSEFLSMNETLSKSIYPLADLYKLANPVIVKREQNGFLPLYACYFFSEKDSVLRFISYDWERDRYGNYFNKKEIWKEESKKIRKYNAEYERLKASMIVQSGKPVAEDTEPQVAKSSADRGDYFTRNTTWETADYFAELTMTFESMTYRIRMNYYWKE